MESTISVFRTEKKYRLPEDRISSLYEKMSYISKRDQNSGRDGYLVRSLYFDSIFDEDYMDKLDGLENRKKIRLRLYDPSQERVKLELKQKQGANQLKKSMWISREIAMQMLEGNYSELLSIDNPLAAEFYTMLEMGVYRPKCIVEYKRVAFMEETNNTRITLDMNIVASKDTGAFFDNEISGIPVVDNVLEVKYNGFLLSHFKQIVNTANSAEISVSKYAMSRELLG